MNLFDIIKKAIHRNNKGKKYQYICESCTIIFDWNHIIKDKDGWICSGCCIKKYNMISDRETKSLDKEMDVDE